MFNTTIYHLLSCRWGISQDVFRRYGENIGLQSKFPDVQLLYSSQYEPRNWHNILKALICYAYITILVVQSPSLLVHPYKEKLKTDPYKDRLFKYESGPMVIYSK